MHLQLIHGLRGGLNGCPPSLRPSASVLGDPLGFLNERSNCLYKVNYEGGVAADMMIHDRRLPLWKPSHSAPRLSGARRNGALRGESPLFPLPPGGLPACAAAR